MSLEPIPFDVPPPCENNYVSCEDDCGWYCHDGVRVRWAKPAWANGKLLIHIMGGSTPAPREFEEEGAAFLIDKIDLMALAFDLAELGKRL